MGSLNGHEELSQMPLSANIPSQILVSRNLPSFPSAFSTAQSKKAVVKMQTIIHPPGMNPQMQQLMRSRLPNTSSLSETEVSTADLSS